MPDSESHNSPDPYRLVEHLFRTKSGELVARLSRIVGVRRLELVEDVVQEALLSALRHWSFYGIPENPVGWLFTAARNRALDRFRHEKIADEKTDEITAEIIAALPEQPETGYASEIADSQLRLMFALCDSSLSAESQAALILKTLGGLSVPEIARAFLAKESTIAQRLVRARHTLAETHLALDPPLEQLAARLDTVLQVIYLFFNEGYNSYQGENLVRYELVNEALRFARLLAEHPLGQQPEAYALLSLLALQASRLPSRVDPEGNLVLLADQDREKWDRTLIAEGFHYLQLAAVGEAVTGFHLEAGIAACHAMAPDYASTNWSQILEYYDALVMLNNSPVVALNRAVALAMVEGPSAGLAALDALVGDAHLQRYYLYHATRGELLVRLHMFDRARSAYTAALDLTSSEPERRFLQKQIEACHQA
jgi:RNA polymerase sigma-70 factor (ECF subfamily)